MRIGMLIILWTFALVTVAQSQQPTTDEKQKERAAYEAELQKLKREKPKEYEDFRRLAIFATQSLLGTLGYGVGPFNGILDEKTKESLRDYQKQRKLPVTGEPLSIETVDQVRDDTDALKYEPIVLPRFDLFLDYWNEGLVFATGTWAIVNEKQMWPEQSSNIRCSRNSGTCIDATVVVSGKTGVTRMLEVHIEVLEIERWDDVEITTTPKDFLCTRYVRRINRVQKTVTGLRSTIAAGESCKHLDTNEKQLVLSDGFKVWWDLHQNSKKTFRELARFSPEMRKYLEQAIDK